jgi:hypothetical protein
MKTVLTKGLSKDQAAEIEQDFKAAAYLRERLTAILDDKIDALRREVRQKNSYDSPSWAYVQADYIGYERAIYEVISLLSSESVEKITKTK